MTNINNIIEKIRTSLALPQYYKNELTNLVSDKEILEKVIDQQTETLLDKLLDYNKNLSDYEKKLAKVTNTKESQHKTNYTELKKTFAKLEVKILLKYIDKPEDLDNIINKIVNSMTQKIKVVNEVMISNLVQEGGGEKIDFNIINEIIYFKKYIKYKNKYLELKKL